MSPNTIYERVEQRGGFKFIRLKSGRVLSFWNAMTEAERANTALHTAVSRAFKLARGDDWELEHLESFIDNLEDYVRAIRTEIEKVRGIKTKQDRIALLRNTAGRTPEEAAEFNRKADELERRLEERV